MKCRRSMRLASIMVLVVLAAATRAPAIGYWNVPGNSCQWWGCGWGAGHHACLMLGPSTSHGAFDHREIRLPHAPRPPYSCNGCGVYHYDFRQTHAVAPVAHEHMPMAAPELVPETLPDPANTPAVDGQPSPDPLPTPEGPMSARPLFAAPVER